MVRAEAMGGGKGEGEGGGKGKEVVRGKEEVREVGRLKSLEE